MDAKVKYLYLAFTRPPTIKGQIATFKYIMDFFNCDDALEFCSKFVKSGNHLYGEYMKHKVKELKSKINE